MPNDIEDLKKEFAKIKNMGLVKLLRKGPTGIGYTFETLLGKKEDQECKPDFKSIEIKCKFGFSNTHFTLFTCAPTREGETAYNYIYRNYAFERLGDCHIKTFCLKFFSHYTINKEGFTFKLCVNDFKKRIILKAYYNNEFLEDVCYWDFNILEEKLYTKLNQLALVDCYPYKIAGEDYIKYVKITFYKLKSFEKFLNLIKNDTICIETSIKEIVNNLGEKVIDCHGFQFRIRKENIEKLFDKLDF